ncbi:sulfite exporter TauE/SafE family protein [uncultured Roseovarius sp.]|uniref:sulfite exporter TauE/SafE family protein n=1 Tax=uncultured Roseovarius sp. TaxID=293344 RepID=UPI00262270A2|nr:sulfite exporter TauE/SafE family protein [uncultured Roseovarius sp.]
MDLFFGITSPAILIFAFLISILGGLIKGVVGFAMPTVLVSGLGSFATAEVALAGMIMPTLITNGWQALRQGPRAAIESLNKFRVFLLAGFVVMMLSAQLVPLVPGWLLLLVIGVLITLFITLQIQGIRLRLPGHPGRRTQVAIGGVTGFMGGISGIWGPPTVAMLTALDTEKKEQIRIQGVIYGLGSVTLVAAHWGSGVLRAETLPLSLALIPTAVLGMAIGFRIQDRIDQSTFKKATLAVLLIGGLNLIRRGLAG